MNHFVLIHKKIEELQKEYTRKIVFQTFLHLQTPDFNSSIVIGIYTTNRKYDFYTNDHLYSCKSAYPRKVRYTRP